MQEVVNVNLYTTEKGPTQRSSMWVKIADTLNIFTVSKFRVDKRSVRNHVGILVHKKKLQTEEKATGVTADEPTELENLLDTIMAFSYRKHREQVLKSFNTTGLRRKKLD